MSILEQFMMQGQSPPTSPPRSKFGFERRRSRSAENIDIEFQESRRSSSASHSSKLKVAKIMDNYLQEIARDVNLPLSKFITIAEAIPDFARSDHDDLYRAIDIYLKSHQRKSLNLMKPAKVEAENFGSGAKRAVPPPPPLPPRLPGSWARRTGSAECITNREIAKFWRRKRIEEEDHLLAAIKAAARVRARNFSANDYKQFIESLEDADGDAEGKNSDTAAFGDKKKYENEVRVGIKDWWTRSKYAYLNQPAIGSVEKPRSRAASYTPNCFSYKPIPLYPTSLGVY